MKKIYEVAEINVVMFKTVDVIVASSEEVFTPSVTLEENETEIL